MGQHRVCERDDASTPLVHDVMESQQCTDVRLVEAEHRLRDVSGPPRSARGQLVWRPDLELKTGVQFAEVMQEREKRQAGRGRVGEFVGARCVDEPHAQHRILEQGFEACRDVGAVMFQAMDAPR